MSTRIAILFYVISLLIMCVDIAFTRKAYAQKSRQGVLFGRTCTGAFIVSASYVISTLPMSKFWVSLFSSIYFVSIDWTLWFLLQFVREYAGEKKSKLRVLEYRMFQAYMAFDCAVLMINPFWEIALHYEYRDAIFAQYSYDMLPLYKLHLVFSYLLILSIFIHLILKAHKAPASYRNPYILSCVGLIVIICLNAVYLYWPNASSMLPSLDVSIWMYSMAEMVFYWSCFVYPQKGMLHPLRYAIMESVRQGMVLFDYEDRLLLANNRAGKMLQGVSLEEGSDIDSFMKSCGIFIPKGNYDRIGLFQCFPQGEESAAPLQCDYRPVMSESNQSMGRLFVFTDVESETDPLTGFYNWDNFRSTWADRPGCPMTVAVCDINRLQNINSKYSHAEGDWAIKKLAEAMKRHFPADTYFVRGMDAALIALCHYTTEQIVLGYLKKVQEDPELVNSAGERIYVQSAVSCVNLLQPSALVAVSEAEATMRAKKMLDTKSAHSALLTSLIRVLQECNSDAEDHIRRTQEIGEILGERMQLSDSQRSELSLLCVLHDIGMIGIPLGILNKPGKLSPEEWSFIQSHVRRGYEIAASSVELRNMADMILHHHENWDGTGYPDGLSKESIPLLSRIIAVIDAYDAMVNDRPYRQALSREEILRELRQGAGVRFDPSIVTEMLELIDEGVLVPPANIQPTRQQGSKEKEEEAQQGITGCVHKITYSRYTIDEEDYIVSVDDQFVQLTGYSWEDVKKLHLRQRDLIVAQDLEEYLRMTNEELAWGDMAYFEHRILRKDGTTIYVFCIGRRFFDSIHHGYRSEIIITDTARSYSVGLLLNNERSKAISRLHRWEDKYRCDSLTGLLNHESFKSDVEEVLLHGERKVMMLMMDVDNFKEYNDSRGHRLGDEFLILVAQTLSASLRKNDLACRMGGDEFAAALFFAPTVPDEVMLNRAQQLCDRINMVINNEGRGTSLSMGVAVSTESRCSFKKLYEAADKALYDAKNAGKSRMAFAGEKE